MPTEHTSLGLDSLSLNASQDSGKRSIRENALYKDVMAPVEDVEQYRVGGFAPVNIGDTLINRFEVVHKLGHGGIAMVWLCWDLLNEKWRAVKINNADYSYEDCGDLKAVELMQKHGVTLEKLEQNHVAMALESFLFDSPNGKHLCFVMEVLGPRLYYWRTGVNKDQERIKNVCYQITKGLSFLHSHGLCHGDFRPQNVLMRLRPGMIDRLTKKGMLELLGEPRLIQLQTTDGKESPHAPKNVVRDAPWERFQRFMIDEAAVVDFGESYEPWDAPAQCGIPLKYAAPEILFEKGRLALASDIWSLAITLLELRTDEYGAESAYAILRKMELSAGPIPFGYRHAARRLLRNDGYHSYPGKDSPYELRPLTGPLEIPLNEHEERDFVNTKFSGRLEMYLASQKFAWYKVADPQNPTKARRELEDVGYHMEDNEVRVFADLLQRMLKYRAGSRITASQALRHRWFVTGRSARLLPMPIWRYRKDIVGTVLLLVLSACIFWITLKLWAYELSHHDMRGSSLPDWFGNRPVTVYYS